MAVLSLADIGWRRRHTNAGLSGIAMSTNWRKLFSDTKAALLRRGRTEDDADDLVQTAYLRVADQTQNTHIENLDGYFMRTALNLSIDAHRTARARGEAVLPDDHLLLVEDPAPALDDVLLGRECIERMEVCLARLSERTRQMFMEYRVEGMTLEEIARKHDLNISTVHHHLSKAMFQVAGGMSGWWP